MDNNTRILVINPGSTSTKIAVFRNGNPTFLKTIRHSVEELSQFKTIADDFSTELSLLLKKYNVELYYNSCDEDTNIKYNGEELNVAITDLIKE